MEERTKQLEIGKTKIKSVQGKTGKNNVKIHVDLMYGNITKPMTLDYFEIPMKDYTRILIDFLNDDEQGKEYIIPSPEQVLLDCNECAKYKDMKLTEIKIAQQEHEKEEAEKKRLQQQEKEREEQEKAEQLRLDALAAEERDRELSRRADMQAKFIKQRKTLIWLLAVSILLNLIMVVLMVYENFLA